MHGLKDLSAIVLAAGQSSRMGEENKLLLSWDGRRIIQVCVDTIREAGLGQTVVVLGFEAEEVQEYLLDRDVKIVLNPHYKTGMAGSLKRGLDAIDRSCPGFLIALGDMPNLKADTIRKLGAALLAQGEEAIVAPRFNDLRGNPVIFGSAYRREIMRLEGDRGAKRVLMDHQDKLIEVPVDDGGVIEDVDTPEAYNAYRRRNS